ncbi:glutamine-hydrolyzing GMP synthase [Tepidimicrobium xylanilyticum]|uniref:GMP synthase [glutamine-hydrolyzing] n=1 Tax=Tepidimicrobium xylanilyticum TaxID=1123352 RepID=A0A1H2Q7T5_9FIRM|nr:glutamine-hydrolyzing GMP synthase [Tepidimicrobium xylanilyticum]SDW03135.1 GMP synthase (glutamine-hydrolysing) [Tepidimicrobium xylanilyticum]
MILILDLGSKFSRFLGRRIRESKVYCEIVPYNYPMEKIKGKNPEGIIISGEMPIDIGAINGSIFELGVPVLSIGYGADLLVQTFRGSSIKPNTFNYKFETINADKESLLFNGLYESLSLWLDKEYVFDNIPEGFETIGYIDGKTVAIENRDKKIYAVMFHPEIETSNEGKYIIDNFLFKVCNAAPNWNMEEFIENTIEEIRKEIGDRKALCALSGGVDSSVAAVLVHNAIGDNLICVFVDHGLLRKNEKEQVEKVFRDQFHMNLITVDAKDRFLKKLKGVTDPEKKRKIIGEEFIRVFEEEQKKLDDIGYLVQGTIYPDVIESGLSGDVAVKSHHNVGGLPDDYDFELVEPLRQLFKDEVRKVGRLLGISEEIVERQPFPGPGLGVRVLGEVTEEKLNIVREADYIFRDEIKKAKWDKKIWQYFAVLPDIKTVGIKDGERTYTYTIALRAINSVDGMTAQWVRLPLELLEKISNRITEEIPQVNRVVYDITNKPPATIEWE